MEITVPGCPMLGRRALKAKSVDHEESIQQDQLVIKKPSQPAARELQVNNNKTSRRGKPTRSKIASSRRSGLGHQEVAEAQRASPG